MVRAAWAKFRVGSSQRPAWSESQTRRTAAHWHRAAAAARYFSGTARVTSGVNTGGVNTSEVNTSGVIKRFKFRGSSQRPAWSESQTRRTAAHWHCAAAAARYFKGTARVTSGVNTGGVNTSEVNTSGVIKLERFKFRRVASRVRYSARSSCRCSSARRFVACFDKFVISCL